MKQRIETLNAFLKDLESGKAIDHQPTRRGGNAKWYVLQRIKEGNPLEQK